MNKKILVIACIALGLVLILIGYNQKDTRINNFKGNDTEITIIDLSKEERNHFNFYLISGFLLITTGLIVTITSFKVSTKVKTIDPFVTLTAKEKAIVQLINDGKSNKEIASELFISLSTVKSHINNIYRKLQIKSRAELFDLVKK